MRTLDIKFLGILEKSENGQPLDREDCRYLLQLDEKSLEAGLLRATASSVIRSKNENSAILLGQIGVDVNPCPGGCKFCTFGEKHTHFSRVRMPEEELTQKIEEFCHYGDLYGLYLMTMHDYDREHYLKCVELACKIAPVHNTNLGKYRGYQSGRIQRASRCRCYRRISCMQAA